MRFLVLLLLVTPAAVAAEGGGPVHELTFSTPSDFTLDGKISLETSAGSLTSYSPSFSGTGHIWNASGFLEVWSYEYDRNEITTIETKDATLEEFELVNAHMVQTQSGDPGAISAFPEPGGRLRVEGGVRDSGHPVALDRDVSRDLIYSAPQAPTLTKLPRELEHDWQDGWMVSGTMMPDHLDMAAFPSLSGPRLNATGPVALSLFGGKLRVEDASGVREFVLGFIITPGPPGFEHVIERRAIFEGSVIHTDLPLGDRWGLAAPEIDWVLDGEARWTHATGSSARTEFTDAAVSLALDGVIRSTTWHAVMPMDVTAQGDFRSLVIDGATLVTPNTTRSVQPTIAVASAFALIALALVIAFLYTRLTPADLLLHPQRQRIMDILNGQPGIHQRELHREAGGAWGAFSFHFRMLQKAGHLRVAKQGGYTLVFPASTSPTNVTVIPHPIARAVYDALPQDGAPIPLSELAEKVDESRELVSYHLRALEARGLVQRVQLDGQRRGVVRVLVA